MRNIYTSIDIGSESIKIVVLEFIRDKFHVLAKTSVNSVGVKRGVIVDFDMALNSLRLALDEIKKTLGTSITKAIVCIPSNDRELSIASSSIEINNDVIEKEDIGRLLFEVSKDKKEGYELVSVIPIVFKIDGDKYLIDPLNYNSSSLFVKAVLAFAPKKNVFDILKLVNSANIECVDITFNCIGDYYEAKTNDTENSLGAIINIGYEKTDISLFNKGILIKNSMVPLGSKNIDKDISYIYRVDLNTSKELKEKFSSSTRRFADINESIEFNLSENEKISVNQYEITDIVEARISEILKLAKKEINNLTKRKISYIIVTGGITELMGFSYVVENILGINSSCLMSNTIGVRNNKYSSSIGVIKYYHEKINLRGEYLPFFDDDGIYEMNNNIDSALELTDDVFTSKIFGYLVTKEGM